MRVVVAARLAALLVALLVVSACGDPDPCDGIANTCVTLHVRSSTVRSIDQLELDLLWSEHATTTIEAAGTVDLPVDTAIEIANADAAATIGVVAAGKLGGNVLGTGAGTAALAGHTSLVIELAPIVDCVAGGLYCGGDKLAGDPQTLYECNGGGVPLARGACLGDCVSRPTDDDTCTATGGTCIDGALYCGGDKLEGDPQTLYRCAAGAGTVVMTCPTACRVNPGSDDGCE
jgi:hypothetical protein